MRMGLTYPAQECKSLYMLNPRELRQAIGLSQGKFAQLVGVTRQCVNAWERNRWRPSTLSVIRFSQLANRFGVHKLLGLREHSSRPIKHSPSLSKLERYEVAHDETGMWRNWSKQKRRSWKAHRAIYAKMLADEAAGRAIIEWKP
jgi:DNA-binding XRE family transcriptional regulator